MKTSSTLKIGIADALQKFYAARPAALCNSTCSRFRFTNRPLVVLLCSVLVGIISQPCFSEEILRPVGILDTLGNKTANMEPRKKYQFIKDKTEVEAPTFSFETNVDDSDGYRLSDSILIAFSYAFDGKKPKRPLGVNLRFSHIHRGSPYVIKNLYLRFNDKKLTLPVKSDGDSATSSISLSSGTAIIPSDIFQGMSKAKEIYLSTDNIERIFLIDGKNAKPLQALVASIPSAPKKIPTKVKLKK